MQYSLKIHFINRADNANTGDWAGSPLKYYYDFFQQYTVIRHDIENIHWLEIGPRDVVIMGSGGMLYVADGFQKNIQRLYETTPHVIVWAVGFNTHYGMEITQSIDVNRFRLIGIRDYAHPSGLDYVPCVSCLAPELRKRAKIKRRIGVIEHPYFCPIPDLPYEKIANNVNFEILADFIATSEIILASSYHAALWSILMSKRTLCIPWSTKFEYFKYKPVIYSGNIEGDIDEATIHEDALEDSIERNAVFFTRVKDCVASAITEGSGRYQRLHEMERLASLDFQQEILAGKLNFLGDQIATVRHSASDEIAAARRSASDQIAAVGHSASDEIAAARHSASDEIAAARRSASDQIAAVRHSASDEIAAVLRSAEALHARTREQATGALAYVHSRLDDILRWSNFHKITALCFGTGSMAENILPSFRPELLDIKAFIDERPSMRGATYAGSPVIDFQQIAGCSFDCILVACRPADRISDRLRASGIPEEKIVSLDVENLFWQQDALDEVGLRAALLVHLRSFPGLIQAIDVPVLLDSPWLKNVRAQKRQADEVQKILLPENASIPNRTTRKLLSHLAVPPPLPQLPRDLSVIHIEPSNICSYRCFCCSVWKTKRPRGVLPDESLHLFIQRVGIFRGEVALNYCGEPLQDKKLPEKIHVLRQAWPEATLNFVSTLGEDVGETFLDALWDNGLNRLDVSFYGYTPGLYKKIHGVPRYALARKNLQRVLESSARKRNNGQVRLRVLHVEEQAPFLDADYPAAAAAFRAEVSAYPGVSSMDTYLMTQAGAGKVHSKRGTWLPCSIAWGTYARELYVTWELDVALCCAATGDELRLGNLRDQNLEEIFAAKPFQDLVRAHWEDNLDAYPFCRRCERSIGGTTKELVRIASWKIANLLRQSGNRKPVFSIVGEPRLAGPLAAFYRQHVPGFLPLAALREEKTGRRAVWVFIAAQGGAQISLYRELREDAVLAAKPGLRVIPLFGAGFPQSQEIMGALADIYAGLDIPGAISK